MAKASESIERLINKVIQEQLTEIDLSYAAIGRLVQNPYSKNIVSEISPEIKALGQFFYTHPYALKIERISIKNQDLDSFDTGYLLLHATAPSSSGDIKSLASIDFRGNNIKHCDIEDFKFNCNLGTFTSEPTMFLHAWDVTDYDDIDSLYAANYGSDSCGLYISPHMKSLPDCTVTGDSAEVLN